MNSSRDRSTPRSTREDTLEVRAISHDAVADLVERVCHTRGGAKALTDRIDLSYSQIRRMAGDGSIPNLEQILRFIALAGADDSFRLDLIAHLERMFDPSAEEMAELVVERVEHGQPVREAVREVVEVVQVYPGRWARVR